MKLADDGVSATVARVTPNVAFAQRKNAPDSSVEPVRIFTSSNRRPAQRRASSAAR